jgi:hypothetical protein
MDEQIRIMDEVFYVAIKKDDEWIPNILEIGSLCCRFIEEPMIHYDLHVSTPWLAYKFMEELKEKNPGNEYKIFKSVGRKFDSSTEFDLEPLLKWWNDSK